jgi:long-chain acyl-CoA synthetase
MYVPLTHKLAEIVRGAPEKVAILSREGDSVQTFTYGQIFEACQRLAGGLLKMGVKKGDRLAIMLENRPEWPICYFGLLMAGAVAVPLDLQSRPGQIEYMLKQTRARVLFTSGQGPLEELANLPFLHRVVLVGPGPALKKVQPFPELLEEPAGDFPRLQAEDLASIIFTSGTTGPPKGVMLTHKNFLANFLSIQRLEAIRPEDNFLSLLPLFHAFPFIATLIVPLFSGTRITYLNTLKPEQVLRCIREQKVTILAVTPQVLEHFYQGIRNRLAGLPLGLGTALIGLLHWGGRLEPVLGLNPAQPLLRKIRAVLGPQFRFFISGGAKLPVDLQLNLRRLGFEVREGYGLTETAPVVSLNPPEAPKTGSVGKPLPGVEVRIRDPDPQGVGEILIRGDNVTPGYYRNKAATRKALRDGWFYSGDLGYLDQDGYLFVKERLKDIIVLRSGQKVSAGEVARHYLQAATIKEIYVMPDPREEKLVAVVVPDFDYFRASGETDVYGEVKWHLEYYSQQLEPYKRVRDFVLINQELPKTRLGKVRHHEAEALYRERAGRRYEKKKLAQEEELSEVGEAVVEILGQQTGSDRIALDDHLELDLGLDSLALVELVAALEERFGIAIREEEFSGIFTVAELIRFIEGKHPEFIQIREEKARTWQEILRAEPPAALLAKVSLDSGFGGRLFTLGGYLALAALFRLFLNLRIFRTAELGPAGYILCPNHASYLDGFLVFTAVPRQVRPHLFFMGYSRYFDKPLVRNLVRLMRVIPVNSARHLVEAMQAAAFVLRRGGVLCIFPEGARSLSGHLRTFKKGVAVLAKELNIRLVPVFIRGSYEAWPAHAVWPRPYPVTIGFGRSYDAAELKEEGLALQPGAPDYEAITLGLREAVIELGRELEEKVKD